MNGQTIECCDVDARHLLHHLHHETNYESPCRLDVRLVVDQIFPLELLLLTLQPDSLLHLIFYPYDPVILLLAIHQSRQHRHRFGLVSMCIEPPWRLG